MDKSTLAVAEGQLAASEGSSPQAQEDAEKIVAVLTLPIGSNSTAIVGTVGYFCGDDEPLGTYRWNISASVPLEEAAGHMDFISRFAESRVLGR